MKWFNKSTLWIFVFLSLFSLVVSLISAKGLNIFYLFFIVLAFNFLLFVLFISVTNTFYKLTKRKEIYFILLFFSFLFAFWYISSAFAYLLEGSFLSWNAWFFIFQSKTILFRTIFMICLILGLFLFSGFVYKKRVSDFKESYKNYWFIFFVALLACAFLLSLSSFSYILNASPVTHSLAHLLIADPPLDFNYTNTTHVPVLNFTTKLNKPNIVVIMLESVSYNHLGQNGYFRNVTPNLDSFANKSIVFNSAFSSASHSDYSQTAFLSSRYPVKSKIRDSFTNNEWPKELIWQVLKEQGYSTYYFSSQDDNWLGIEHYLQNSGLDIYSPSMADGIYDYGFGLAKKDFDNNTLSKTLTVLNSTSKPFFMYVDFQSTHNPYTYPTNESIFEPDKVDSILTNEFNIAKSDLPASINRYDNSIHYVDEQVGLLLNYLNSSKLLNNTIVIVTSDHGESFGEAPRNQTRHGYGDYNQLVHVPLMIYVPGKKHLEINDSVKHIDVLPTVLNISNLNSSNLFQGSVMFKGEPIFFIAQNYYFQIGMLQGDIKYLYTVKNYSSEVYNISADPQETHNLIVDPASSEYYMREYGSKLFAWYDCQINFYERGYLENNVISC